MCSMSFSPGNSVDGQLLSALVAQRLEFTQICFIQGKQLAHGHGVYACNHLGRHHPDINVKKFKYRCPRIAERMLSLLYGKKWNVSLKRKFLEIKMTEKCWQYFKDSMLKSILDGYTLYWCSKQMMTFYYSTIQSRCFLPFSHIANGQQWCAPPE